jgi:hypothetical protein
MVTMACHLQDSTTHPTGPKKPAAKRSCPLSAAALGPDPRSPVRPRVLESRLIQKRNAKAQAPTQAPSPWPVTITSSTTCGPKRARPRAWALGLWGFAGGCSSFCNVRCTGLQPAASNHCMALNVLPVRNRLPQLLGSPSLSTRAQPSPAFPFVLLLFCFCPLLSLRRYLPSATRSTGSGRVRYMRFDGTRYGATVSSVP